MYLSQEIKMYHYRSNWFVCKRESKRSPKGKSKRSIKRESKRSLKRESKLKYKTRIEIEI